MLPLVLVCAEVTAEQDFLLFRNTAETKVQQTEALEPTALPTLLQPTSQSFHSHTVYFLYLYMQALG